MALCVWCNMQTAGLGHWGRRTMGQTGAVAAKTRGCQLPVVEEEGRRCVCICKLSMFAGVRVGLKRNTMLSRGVASWPCPAPPSIAFDAEPLSLSGCARRAQPRS